MPYAITLRLDARAAAVVAAMWEALAARGLSDEALRLDYPPHLTLAVCPDGADPARLIAAARERAGDWRALPISLASFGLFPGDPAVVFLAPVVTAALLARHGELLASLGGDAVDPLYRCGHWVPHVTLAGDLSDPAAAMAMPGAPAFPITAVLDTLEVVRFRPVNVLASYRLMAA
jgi:2'-5' RNA ligase